MPNGVCPAANREREESASAAAAHEAEKGVFLKRLDETFGKYEAYAKASKGTDFRRFHEFKGTIPAALRGDWKVERRVRSRLNAANELRRKYASNAPSPKTWQARAQQQSSQRRDSYRDTPARQQEQDR